MSSQYLPPYVVSKNNNIKGFLDLSGYAREDDLAYFRGKDYIQQNYLVFKPKYKYFKTFADSHFTFVSSWESKGLSNEKIISPKTTDTDSSPKVIYNNGGVHLRLISDYLKQDKVVYNHGSIVNIYVVYELSFSTTSDITLDNCLFGAITLTKNSASNPDQYKYSGYGTAFNSKTYSHKDSGKNAKDLIIFSADLTNSSHAENKKNNILVLGENSVKLNNTTIQAESTLKTNRTVINQKFVLSLHYNGDNSYLFVNGVH